MGLQCVLWASPLSPLSDKGVGVRKKPLSTGGVFVHALAPLKASDLFTLPPSLALFRGFFAADAAPWDWVKQVGPALAAHPFGAAPSDVPAGVHIEGNVFLGEGVVLPAQATILGPAWIGTGCQIRPGAYIRGNVIAGEGC